MKSSDGKIMNRLVAGSYREMIQTGIQTISDLLIFWSQASEGGSQSLEISDSFQTLIYLIDGKIELNGVRVEKEQLIIFEKPGKLLEMTALLDSNFLVLSGKPIKENVFQHGPFVMNNKTEILEAMRDYQMGKMGYLVEE